MACEVCGAHPTWADLTECEFDFNRLDCPWRLDPRKPIPPYPSNQRHVTPEPQATGPAPVIPLTGNSAPLPVVVQPDVAQPHSQEEMADKLQEGLGPQPTFPRPPALETAVSEEAESSKPSFLEMARRMANKPAPPPKKTVQPPTPVATPVVRTYDLDSQTLLDDYQAIQRAISRMNWSGSFGPDVWVTTNMKRKTPEGWLLRNYCKQELQDRIIRDGNTNGRTLYYYVTSLCTPGKAGFRITGHSKPSNRLNSSSTFGVLHVDNS